MNKYNTWIKQMALKTMSREETRKNNMSGWFPGWMTAALHQLSLAWSRSWRKSASHTHTHEHAHGHTHEREYEHTHTYTQASTNICTYTYKHEHVHINIRTRTYTHKRTPTRKYTHKHTRTRTYTHKNTHTQTQTQTYSHKLKHTSTLIYTHALTNRHIFPRNCRWLNSFLSNYHLFPFHRDSCFHYFLLSPLISIMSFLSNISFGKYNCVFLG